MSFEKKEAIKALYEYVFTGAYGERTHVDEMKKNAKERLCSLLINSDEKRHIFSLPGEKYIAKFVAKEIKETNHEGLISDLLDYVRSEALSKVITLDMKRIKKEGLEDALAVYKQPDTYFVRFTPNKMGKSYKSEVIVDMNMDNTDELVKMIAFHSERSKMLESYQKKVMAMFQDMTETSLKTDVGTVSKIANKPTWDIVGIIKAYGDDFILKYGTVMLTSLEDWFAIGLIPRSVLSDNQQVVDIRLDFMVLSEDAEKRMLNAYRSIQDWRLSKTISDVI